MMPSTSGSTGPWQKALHVSRWFHLEHFRDRPLVGSIFTQSVPTLFWSAFGHFTFRIVIVGLALFFAREELGAQPGAIVFELFLIAAAVTLTDGSPIGSDRRGFLSTLPVDAETLVRGRLLMILHRGLFELSCILTLAALFYGISWIQDPEFGVLRLTSLALVYIVGVFLSIASSIPETDNRRGPSAYRRQMLQSQAVALLGFKWALALFSGLDSGVLKILELSILMGLLAWVIWALKIQLGSFDFWSSEDEPTTVDVPVFFTWVFFVFVSSGTESRLGPFVVFLAAGHAAWEWIFRQRSQSVSRKTRRRYEGLIIGLFGLLAAGNLFEKVPMQWTWAPQLALFVLWIGFTFYSLNFLKSAPNLLLKAPRPPMTSAADAPSHFYHRNFEPFVDEAEKPIDTTTSSSSTGRPTAARGKPWPETLPGDTAEPSADLDAPRTAADDAPKERKGGP